MVIFKNTTLVMVLLILQVLLLSCKEDTIAPEMFGNISGVVLDANDNSPIMGASITTSPPTNVIITDASGKFQYSNIAAGDYTISITKNDYVKNAVSVQVRDGETTSPTILLNKSVSNNMPPNEPSKPSPNDNAVNQPVSLSLSWSASDPNKTDTLLYDVYLYESNNPVITQVAADIADTTILLENLQYSTTYFWQVKVKDGKASTYSSTWSFTTVNFPNNPFLYASNVSGNYEIYSSNSTGSSAIRLTNNSYRDWYPRLSPNGSKIAFISDRQINPQIYTMNPDGSNISKITSLPIAGYHNNGIGFSWSPDGGQIIYPNYDKLYKIDQFGSNLALIANAPINRNFRETDWSSANNKIVALTIGENIYDSEIYLMDDNGSNMTLFFSNLPGIMESPSFSVDGKSIMFTRDVSGYESLDGRQLNSHIFIMSVDGSDTLDVSANKPAGTNDLQPRFSPDGAHIIFINSSNILDAPADIWIMDITGNNRTKVIDNAIMPDWN